MNIFGKLGEEIRKIKCFGGVMRTFYRGKLIFPAFLSFCSEFDMIFM